ncbi:MAG: hypothetical protein KC636_39015, partial [Myxococcales bacterium]|nr:hypothetical protein [Myxococcales bacterium]
RSRLVVDTAATGHFLRLLEMPELLDRWIKAIFSVLLRHRHTIRAPRLSDRLIALSRGLKRLRALLRDDARARALLVTLPTEMAYAEAGDLLDACARLELSIAGVILNRGEDAALGCPMCQAIAQREQLVAQRWAGVEHRGAVGRVTRGRPPLGAAALTDLGARLLAGGRA